MTAPPVQGTTPELAGSEVGEGERVGETAPGQDSPAAADGLDPSDDDGWRAGLIEVTEEQFRNALYVVPDGRESDALEAVGYRAVERSQTGLLTHLAQAAVKEGAPVVLVKPADGELRRYLESEVSGVRIYELALPPGISSVAALLDWSESTEWDDVEAEAKGDIWLGWVMEKAVPPSFDPPDEDAPQTESGVKPFPMHLIEGDDLISRTVREIVASALLPQPALALGNVIAAFGAVIGRRVETDTRLRTNSYILGIADSGAGKNHSRTFTEQLLTLGVLDHYMGPGRWSSESGLRAALLEQPSHVSQLDEFGDRMLATTGRNAAPHMVGINGFLKEVFTSANSILRGAAYADRVKNPPLPIHEPNLCIYCTATPESLFAGLSSDHVKDGLLNRFLLFFGEPEREPKFEGVNVPPSPALISDWRAVEEKTRPTKDVLGDLHTEATGQNFARVVALDGAAAALRREVHAMGLRRRRALKEQGSQLAPLWQRFPEHVEKLALIRAVSRDPETSTVTEGDMRWAMALAEWSIGNLVAMGEAHLADSDFERQVKKAFAIIDKGGKDGVSQTRLTNRMKLKKRDLQDVIGHLDECRRIVAESIETGGRPKTLFWTRANAPKRCSG